MQCCDNCFDDHVVIKRIQDCGKTGTCDLCKKPAKVLDASELRELFAPLLARYCKVEEIPSHLRDFYSGYTLADCLNEDWCLFKDHVEDADANELLDQIRGVIHRPDEASFQHFSNEAEWVSRFDLNTFQRLRLWDAFAHEIKTTRRFVFDPQFDEITGSGGWFEEALKGRRDEIRKGTVLYRARVSNERLQNDKGEQWGAKEMGCPPNARRVKGGRANPAGITYLYCAEEEATAIAESRAYVGAIVAVSEVVAAKTFTIVDLSRQECIPSPFEQECIDDALDRRAFLNRLNSLLSVPIGPDDQEIDYLPTQYLAERIFRWNYDGIRYGSAMNGGGKNLVLFDKNVEISEPRFVEIKKQEFEYCDYPRKH